VERRPCTKAGLLALLDRMEEVQDALGQIFMLPENQFGAALNDCRRRYAKSSPWSILVLSHAEGMHYAAQRSAICFDMLRAAVAMLLGGPDQLQKYRDPIGSAPYAYKPFKGGFELSSKLSSWNRPPALLMVGEDRSLAGMTRRFCIALKRRLRLVSPS
jgi:hypothetical protein